MMFKFEVRTRPFARRRNNNKNRCLNDSSTLTTKACTALTKMMKAHGLRASKVMLKRSMSTTATHSVFNQSTPLQNINVFKSDPALVDSVKVFGGTHTLHLNEFGIKSGQDAIINAAELAEKNKPTLRQFDNYGRRIDVADYHDAYHTIMRHGLENGCAGHGFKHNTTGSHVTRAALIYMENQLEPGHCCPIVMTAAAIPVFQRYDGVQQYADQIINQKYDPRNVPMDQKAGITIGMSMTEKQGGSDVRANTTTAVPLGNNAYSLTGHKVRICPAHCILAYCTSLEVHYKVCCLFPCDHHISFRFTNIF